MEVSFTSNTTFPEYVKYNAQVGKMFKKDETEILLPFTFIADLEAIKTGWLDFPSAGAPNFVWDAKQFVAGPQPGPNHKRGFGLEISNNPICGGRVEWNCASKYGRDAMAETINKYKSICDKFLGLYPVLKIIGTTPHKLDIPARGGKPAVKTTVYSPIMEIVEWVKTDVFNKSNVVPITVPQAQAPIEQPKAAVVSEF